MHPSKQIVILGSGIKGTALAAIASLFDDLQVTLIERDKIGSGTTSTNHGRLHLGTAGWEKESSQLIQRRRLASGLVRQLPDAVVSKQEGLYCFESEETADQFQQVAKRDKIPYRVANDLELASKWIELSHYKRILRVPEHAFNPARLAGRFAQTCIDLAGKVLTGQDAQSIDRNADKLLVTFENDEVIEADIVVNTLSRWCSTISVPANAPKPEIRWFRWQLLCLHSSALPELPGLEQVIMIIDQMDANGKNKMPSAIPHENWITLDYKETPVRRVSSPEADDAKSWRVYNASNSIDRGNFTVVCDVFQPLKQLSKQTIKASLFSLAGIQGRRLNAPTGSQNYVEMSEDFPGYFVAFGGQASTGFLDAIETIEQIRSQYGMTQHNRDQLVRELTQHLASTPIENYLPMRWEQQSQPE